jgi:hypothetical protein
MALQLALAVSKNGALASAKLIRATQSNFEKESPMAESQSSQRIAADILIATIQSAQSSDASDFLKDPKQIADAFKVIQAAVVDTKSRKPTPES